MKPNPSIINTKSQNINPKSTLTLNLPQINKKYFTSRLRSSNRTDNSYLDSLTTIIHPVDYEQKDVTYLHKQQNKLKGVLKKINSETIRMIEDIRIKPQTMRNSPKRVYQIREKQIENNKKIISNMQYQIEALKVRFQKIAETDSLIQITSKIQQTSAEIEKLTDQNFELRYGILKSGNEIAKGNDDLLQNSKINILEVEKKQIDLKAEKLKLSGNRVDDESQKIVEKLKQIEPKIQQLMKYMNQNKQSFSAEDHRRKKQQALNQKKYMLQNIKKKYEFFATNSQYKYYKLLKELESLKVISDDSRKKEQEIDIRLNKRKDEIAKLEEEYNRLKQAKQAKDKAVFEFLRDKNLVNELPEAEITEKESISRILDFTDEKEAKNESLIFENEMNEKDKDLQNLQIAQVKNEESQRVKQKLDEVLQNRQIKCIQSIIDRQQPHEVNALLNPVVNQ